MGQTLTDPAPTSRLYDSLPDAVRKRLEKHGVTACDFRASENYFADVFTAQPTPAPAEPPPQEPQNRRQKRAKAAQERPARLPDGRYRSAKGRKEEIRERMKRARARDLAHMDRLHRRLKAAGVSLVSPLRCIPRSVWIGSREMMADLTGTAARIHLKQLNNPVAAGAIAKAALVPREDGSTVYTWADARARKIATLSVALFKLGAPTRRKGPFTTVVRGVTRGALCALLEDPYDGSRPGLSALSGRHAGRQRESTLENGQLGYLTALELVGFMYRQQVPVEVAQPFERWGKWASNRYWLVGSWVAHVWDGSVRDEMLRLHELGMSVGDLKPRRDGSSADVIDSEPEPAAQAPPIAS